MLSLATLYFPAGVLIGIAAAAPVGPVNMLVIQHTLCGHRRAALVIGLGAAAGDCLFAIISGFGLGAIAALIENHDAAIRIIGGLVMLAFAGVVWRSAPHLQPDCAPATHQRLALLGFSMAATNPATLLFFLGSFSAIGFVGLGHATVAERQHAALLVAGVLLGSLLWWAIVTRFAQALRGRVADRQLRIINHATAAMLALFGLGAAAVGAAAL
jgi:threonine/homoserine/homoserine lactone efflux protein